MRRLRIPNLDLLKEEKTYLDADYSTGSTSFTVINAIGFAGGEVTFFAIVGEPGEDKTEAQQVSSITGYTTINFPATFRFNHNKGVVVYRSPWDQVEISRYRSAAWAIITQSRLQWDKLETIYIDDDGASTDSYRFRFWNSVSNVYSEYSPTVSGSGFTRNQVGFMVGRVRKAINDLERKVVSDEEIIEMLDTAQDHIKGVRQDWWFLLVDTFKQSDGITIVADQSVYSLANYTDFDFLKDVRYNFDDGTDDVLRHLTCLDPLVFDDRVRNQDADHDDQIEVYKLLPPDSSSDNGYIQVDPTPDNANGTLYPNYFKKMTTLNDVVDETPIPIPSVLETYAIGQCEAIKGNTTKAELYENNFFGNPDKRQGNARRNTGVQLLERMQNAYTHPQGQPRSIKVWRGRSALRDLMQDTSSLMSNDSLKEKYFDWPRR